LTGGTGSVRSEQLEVRAPSVHLLLVALPCFLASLCCCSVCHRSCTSCSR
jgi:hypothetical protein